MGDYAVSFARSARRELEGLQSALANRLFPGIESLKNHSRPSTLVDYAAKRICGAYIFGDYRVNYVVRDKERIVDIVAVQHRSQAY